MDQRDRLILASSALVRAEREAREALQEAVPAGAVPAGIFSEEVLSGLSGRESPSICGENMEAAEAFVLPSRSAAGRRETM